MGFDAALFVECVPIRDVAQHEATEGSLLHFVHAAGGDHDFSRDEVESGTRFRALGGREDAQARASFESFNVDAVWGQQRRRPAQTWHVDISNQTKEVRQRVRSGHK